MEAGDFIDLQTIVETSLCRGPVYFNCYPNFEVSLTDKRLLDVLTLFIQTSGYDMKPGTENIALVYRVSFKVLNTLAPKARKFDVKGSPTYSDMNFTINMIEHNEFKIDRNEINKEFNQPKYKIFKDWFFKSYTKEQTLEFKELFYKCLRENKIIIPFVDWFFSTQDNFPHINMINNYYKNWQTTHGPTITSLHPPLENKIFLSSSNGHPVTAHAISDTFTDNSAHEKILSQNNFTNMHLHTLGKQLTRVESNTDNIIQQIKQPLKSIQPSIPVKQEHVLIPPPTYTQFNLQNKKETNLVNVLVAKLEELKTQEKPTESSSLTIISKETTDKEDNLESENEEINNTELTQLNNQFNSLNEENENSLNKIEFDKRPLKNRVAYGRYYYPRPTPMEVLFEENFINTEKSSFSADQIYEWNIDGCDEQQIFAVLHKMLMYSTICKANNNLDAHIANFIIAGFTGQLKGWWDNILTPLQRNEILTAKKLIQTAAPDTKIVTAEYFEDSVYTLIQTILKHFVGNAFHTMNCSRELLINLRCPTLTHFRWYKDVFLSKIMHRSDGNLSFWKEKYISGLPTLFAERARNRLRGKHSGMEIPLESYTYGELTNEMIAEGLALCNDLNLKAQLKKQGINHRKEIGEFYEQFSYPLIKERKTHKKPQNNKRFYKYRKKKRQNQYQENIPSRKISYKKKIPKRQFIKSVTCHKCGKNGHYANKCVLKKKINTLSLEDSVKQHIYNIIDDEIIGSDSSESF